MYLHLLSSTNSVTTKYQKVDKKKAIGNDYYKTYTSIQRAFREKLHGYSLDIHKDIHKEKISIENHCISNLWSACINYILYYYFVYKYSCYLIYMVMYGGF